MSFEQLQACRTLLTESTAKQNPCSRVHLVTWLLNSASREISRPSWNPKVHFSVHKSPPPAPTVSQMQPIHTPNTTSLTSILMLSPDLWKRTAIRFVCPQATAPSTPIDIDQAQNGTPAVSLLQDSLIQAYKQPIFVFSLLTDLCGT